MNVFVAEYVCSTIDDRPEAEMLRADSLWAEAWMMLDAVVRDLSGIDGVQVRALVSESFHRSVDFRHANWPAQVAVPISPTQEEKRFRELADWCDFALIIAPEFDRTLETRCHWAREMGATLLGPSPDAVRLCADKYALAEHWKAAGVSTIPTQRFEERTFPFPVVVKPRFGAGAQDSLLIQSSSELADLNSDQQMIVQPYVTGIPMSMAFLIGNDEIVDTPPCIQDVVIRDQRLAYRGGATLNVTEYRQRIATLAGKAIQTIPGMFGFVGVDVIVRQAERDVAVEINPRLTTSYVGLRQLCEQNLSRSLLKIAKGEHISLSWKKSDVRWRVAQPSSESII